MSMASDSINQLILDLHEAAGTTPMNAYREWALLQVQREIPFAQGHWCTQHGGDAIDANAKPKTEHRLVATQVEPLSGLCSVISVQRESAQPLFSLTERSTIDLLVSHLFAAWRRCQQLSLYARCTADGGRVAALVDQQGFLHAADGRFFSLLRRNQPDWGGTRLPESLLALVGRGAGTEVIGNIRWSAAEFGEWLYLSGQLIGAAALLTPRERLLAATIVSGQSYRQSAKTMGVSVNTLRNALVRIYRKLDVNSKAELAQRVDLNLLLDS